MSTQNAANDDSDLLDYLPLSKCFCFISLRVCAIVFSAYVVIWFFTVVFMFLLLVVFPCKEQVKARLIEYEQRQQQQYSQQYQQQSPEGGDPMHQPQHDPESPATSQDARRLSESLDRLRLSNPSVILSLTFSSLLGCMGVTSVVAIVNDDAELLKITNFVIMFGIIYFLISTIIRSLQSKDMEDIFCSLCWNIFNIYGIWILWSYYKEIRNK
ncbi:uncharacterized protein LOC124365208 [Homalodisca vitripennis]|uniref:uncharacterized protein LOC124365208 n=1 Tax=Homalodisca vitripennis TaxID=197043 RepID=UPI001EE9FDFD|nr:uncharacterized protein LOC124365208 [Homalodisca vitripennis]